jgi:hypothetical protein
MFSALGRNRRRRAAADQVRLNWRRVGCLWPDPWAFQSAYQAQGLRLALWRDQWGNWQWGDCVPNEGGYGSSYRYDGRGAGWYVPYPDLRGVLPRWGWGYP